MKNDLPNRNLERGLNFRSVIACICTMPDEFALFHCERKLTVCLKSRLW